MIVHVSGREAMEQIRWAQQRGLKVYAETCPQYLTLTADDLKGLNMEGAKYVCSPPPRDAASQAAIWEGLQQGVFQTFSSDHCPFRYQSSEGKLTPKGRTSFRWVPNGIPGVETRLPILFSEGVSAGRISLNRFVELTATNHAKIYGLYPRKGSIGIGFDADITLWDPHRRETIRQRGDRGILCEGARGDHAGRRRRAGPGPRRPRALQRRTAGPDLGLVELEAVHEGQGEHPQRDCRRGG